MSQILIAPETSIVEIRRQILRSGLPSLNCPEFDLGWLLILAAIDVLLVWAKAPAVIAIEPQSGVEPGYVVDYLVAVDSRRVAIEVDGLAYHGSQEAFSRDRRRDRTLLATGLRTVRFTAKEVVEQPARVGAELSEILSRLLTEATG